MRQSTGSRGMKHPSSRHFPPPLILLLCFTPVLQIRKQDGEGTLCYSRMRLPILL